MGTRSLALDKLPQKSVADLDCLLVLPWWSTLTAFNKYEYPYQKSSRHGRSGEARMSSLLTIRANVFRRPPARGRPEYLLMRGREDSAEHHPVEFEISNPVAAALD